MEIQKKREITLIDIETVIKGFMAKYQNAKQKLLNKRILFQVLFYLKHSCSMKNSIELTYKDWLKQLKERVRSSQQKAAVSVNRELIMLYWSLGEDIANKQLEATYGSGFFDNLSKDLKEEFPEMKGFSPTNLKYCKRLYSFYSQNITIRQQAADEFIDKLVCIPWGHHIEILGKCKEVEKALFYMDKTIENGWSRAVLMNFMDAKLHESQGKAITNFKTMLPSPTSDLAQQTLKDPYNFDFLTMHEGYNERQLELALTENITKFLLELGKGFAFVGRQQRLTVGDDEFYIDLLFYNISLRCYVVIELKTEKFKPEYLGQLGFYVSAVNHQLKSEHDNPTIGLVICKTKNSVVAEYSLENSSHPIGISQYELSSLIPQEVKNTLPTIEEIENKLKE